MKRVIDGQVIGKFKIFLWRTDAQIDARDGLPLEVQVRQIISASAAPVVWRFIQIRHV